MTKRPTVIPDFNLKVLNPDFTMQGDWYNFFKDMRNALVNVVDFSNLPEPPDPEITLYDQYPYTVGIPTEMDYVVIQNNDVERDLYETLTDCDTGNCTVQWFIDSTAVGGATHSVSSTESVIARSSDNVIGVGQDLIARVTGNSGTKMLRLNAKTSRTVVVA